MSLTCTVLGHQFGEVDVERSREEEGSEVVSTVREVETCRRCGHERIVSENKEVTTRTTEGGAADEASGSGAAATASSESGDEAVTGGAPEVATGEKPVVPDAETGEQATAMEMEPDESGRDDGVILDEPPDRDPGAWPEEPETNEPDWRPQTDPTSAEPDLEATGDAVAVPDGQFYCGECGFTTPVRSSSLREGDFCPDCHTGSLVHQTDSG